MVISIIYVVLIVIQTISLFVFGVLLFATDRNNILSNIIQLICSIILVINNVFQIPLLIQMGMSYIICFIMIFLFLANALFIAYYLGKNY